MATMAILDAGNGVRPHLSNAAKMVLHIVACLCREEAAYTSENKPATASDRSASVLSEGSAPREGARRPGASTRSGGRA